MRDLRSERPPSIRVIMVCPEGARIERTIDDFFKRERRDSAFPIQLLESIPLPERCHSLVREMVPHVVVLIDVVQDHNPQQVQQWRGRLWQLSENLSRDYPAIATLFLTDARPEEMQTVLESALNYGARNVVNVGRLGDGMVSVLADVERAIVRSYSFVRTPTLLNGVPPTEELKMICVGSGKGGVGKSTIAAALAAEIARRRLDKRVALVDFDVQYGVLATLFGLKSRNSIAQFAHSSVNLENMRTTDDIHEYVDLLQLNDHARLHLLAAPSSPADLAVLTPDRAAQILSTLRRIFDYVIVDLPTQLSDASLAAFQLGDLLLLICEPEVLSIRTNKQLIQLLKDSYIGNPLLSTRIVLNKVWGKSEEKVWGKPLVNVAVAEGTFPDQVISHFPFAPAFVNEHINRGLPFGALDIKHPFMHELTQLFQRIGLDRPAAEKVVKKKSSLLNGILNR
ncbi:MAG: AAA family ATPase [Caldilineaceae bacterium]